MSDLTVYRNVADPLTFVSQLGTELAKSGMFGCESESQGRVLALACMAENRSPIEVMRKYHIIGNRLSMRADAMLADFRQIYGGKHKVLTRTAHEASIELTLGDQVLVETLTWDDAQKEKWPYGKGGKVKDNWATPRGRRQMLWARVVSEGVRTLCPEISAGSYTPEEVTDLADTSTVETPTKSAAELIREQAEQSEIVDAEYEVLDEPVGKVQQVKQLLAHFNATDEQINAILAKRGVQAFSQLTEDQLDELITSLVDRMASESKIPQDAKYSYVTSPCDQATVAAIKSMLVGQTDLIKQLTEWLGPGNKIADLSQEQAEDLRARLQAESINDFFEQDLRLHKPQEASADEVPFSTGS